MSVQFGAKFNPASLATKAIQATDLTQLGAQVVDTAIKAGLKTPEKVQDAAAQVAEVDAQQTVAIAGALIEQQLGDKAAFVKTIALGSDDAAMQAFGETISDADTRLGNVANAVGENLGEKAGLVTTLVAQRALGLIASGLQLLRMGAQVAPGVLAQAKEKVVGEGAPALQEAVSKQIALADAIKTATPGVAAKVGELCDAAAEALQPQA